jgi:hypothetical protein
MNRSLVAADVRRLTLFERPDPVHEETVMEASQKPSQCRQVVEMT